MDENTPNNIYKGIDLNKITSPTLRRLIEEIRQEEEKDPKEDPKEKDIPRPRYNRQHNRHNRSGAR